MNRALKKIADHVPEDLVQQFADKSGITHEHIHRITPGPSGMVSAVDGSNAMIAEGGTISLAAIRAARTTFVGEDRHNRSATPSRSSPSGPATKTRTLTKCSQACFGIPPHKGLDNSDPERASAILRDTLEYWVTLADRTNPARQTPSSSSTGHYGSPARTMNRCLPVL